MTTLEIALTAWLAFLTDLGVDLKPQLLPGASNSELAEVEKVLGRPLPDDLRELYKIANGQLDPYGQKDFKHVFAPMFGDMQFFTLDVALDHYSVVVDFAQTAMEEPDVYNSAEVREGDPMREIEYSTAWWPFAGIDSYMYAVDLDPPKGGSYGQVIFFETAGSQRKVLAASISEFMQEAAAKLDKNDQLRFDYSENDHDAAEYSSVWFDMDWRQEPYDPNVAFEPGTPMAPMWYESLQHYQDDFAAWLNAEGLSATEQDEVIGFFGFANPAFLLISSMSSEPENLPVLEPGAELTPGIFNTMDRPFEYPFQYHNTVFLHFFISPRMNDFHQLNPESADRPYSENDHHLSRVVIISLLHRFQLARGYWTQTQFEQVQKRLHDPAIVELIPEWLVDSMDQNYSGYLNNEGKPVVCSDVKKYNINCDI